MAQRLKRLPAMQGTWVQFLGREDPLEKEMATHSNILAWRIPRMGEHGGLQSTVPGASVRNPTRDNVTQQRSDGQGWVRSQVFPLAFPEHVPRKPKSAGLCTLLFHSSDTLWKMSAQGFCIWKGISIPKPLWWLSSLPAGLVQLRMWLFEASRLREAQEA